MSKKKWMPDIRNHDPSSLVILVALCIDLRINSSTINLQQPDLIATPVITSRQGAELAKRLKCNAFIECSSMLRFRVTEVFECCIDVFERDYQRYSDQRCSDHRQCHTWLCCMFCCSTRKHIYRQRKNKKKVRSILLLSRMNSRIIVVVVYFVVIPYLESPV